MSSDGRDEKDPLGALETRIAALRKARMPKKGRGNAEFNAAALGWRMVLELVTGVLVGGGIGWGIDAVLGTMPIFVVVFGLFGFAAGVRTMLRTAAEHNRRESSRSGAGDETGKRG